MKFSLARPAFALAITLTLASCGGGGKATFPIYVTVNGLQYPGLVLSTNGQDLAVDPPATAGQAVTATFPNPLEYGQTYEVIPKGASITSNHTYVGGTLPKHQQCAPSPFPAWGTAGQLAKIDIRYNCSINSYPLTGVVKGLLGSGLILTNGTTALTAPVNPSLDANKNPTDVPLTMYPVPYNTTYGVTVLIQPTNPNQTCTVSGGANGTGGGTMDDAAEAHGGVDSLVVTCVTSS